MSGRGRMNQGNRDVSRVPVLDVGAALDVPHRNLQVCQMLDDALPVMLEPVSYQHRLSIGGFDQVFQCFQLVVVDAPRFAVLIVDSAIAHLQQLSCQRCGIGSVYVAVLQRDQKILPEHIVELALLGVHLHLVPGRHTIRHIQIIQCLHGNRDIRDALIDHLFGSFSWFVLKHNACGRIHGAGFEVSFPVPTDELSQTLPAIQNSDLCPKVHQAIGGWCAGQSDPPFYERTDFPQVLKTLGLIVLEG